MGDRMPVAGADRRQLGRRGRDRRAVAQPGHQHEPLRRLAWHSPSLWGLPSASGWALSRWADLAFSICTPQAWAIPAVIWALLTTMWFGFGWLTPVVTVFLSGLPFVVVNIAKATRAVPADLVMMARAFGVPRRNVLRHIVAPAVAGSTVAAVRFRDHERLERAAASRVVRLTSGVGWRSRYWYDANQLDGFFAWVLVFIVVLVVADLLLLGPIERYVTPAGAPRYNPLQRERETMASIEIRNLVKDFHDRSGSAAPASSTVST